MDPVEGMFRRPTLHAMAPPPQPQKVELGDSSPSLSSKLFVKKFPFFRCDGRHDSCEKHKLTNIKRGQEAMTKVKAYPQHCQAEWAT